MAGLGTVSMEGMGFLEASYPQPPQDSPIAFPYLVDVIIPPFGISWASLAAQLVKNPPAMRETWIQSLGWEDLLEKEKVTHSSILAWRIPRTTVHGVAKSRTRQSDFHFTTPRDLPDVGFEPGSTILQAESSLSEIVMHHSYPRFFWHLPGGEQPGCSPHWFAFSSSLFPRDIPLGC